MKQVLISALVAAIVAGAVLHIDEYFDDRDGGQTAAPASERASGAVPPGAASAVPAGRAATEAAAPPFGLRYTEALVEDGWVNGARTTGADRKPLEHADNSICFLTKIELRGIQGPADANVCRIEIDGFTGFWELIAEVEDGGQSEVRCNARCLVWE